jgi:FkbM family methyltransferase
MSEAIDCIFAKNKYGNYCIPRSSSHRTVAGRVLGGHTYEKDTIDFILANRGDGAVVHAGAYFGDFLPALASDNAVVYAFEPVFENYRCAKITVDLNYHTHQTKVIHAALGSTHGETIRMITKEQGKDIGCASKVESDRWVATEDNSEEVLIFILDWAIHPRHRVSIIHLDIEGYEEEALKGATELLRRDRPILILEMWQDSYLDTPFFKDFIFGELNYVKGQKLYENTVLMPA